MPKNPENLVGAEEEPIPVVMPKRKYAHLWEMKTKQYRSKYFAVGNIHPEGVKHDISVGTMCRSRVFAFSKKEDFEKFMADHPEAEECLVSCWI